MYLVCDAPPEPQGVEYYMIKGIDSTPVRVERHVDQTGAPSEEHGFKYDLSELAPGIYTIQVSACNQYECSLEAPFLFSKLTTPTAPVGLQILSGA